MTVGSPARGIFKFAVPLTLGYILQQMYLIIDAAIVGRWIGVGALAAVGASSSVMFLIMGFCNGACAGFAIPIAQAFGAKDFKKMRTYVSNAVRIGAVLAVVITLLSCMFCDRILKIINVPNDIFHDAWVFLLLQFLAIPFTMGYNLLSGFIRSLGNSTEPFYFLLASSLLNILLDVVLILMLGMGVEGAGLATLISQAFATMLCCVYIWRRMQLLIPHGEERRYDNKRISILLNNGVPMGLQFSITGIGIIMLQSANNALGTVYVAAFTASMRSHGHLLRTEHRRAQDRPHTQGHLCRREDDAGLLRAHGHRDMAFRRRHDAAVCRQRRDAGRRQRGHAHAHRQLLLCRAGRALHLPLFHPGTGLQQPVDALGRDGDDSPLRSEPVAGADVRIPRRLLWRPCGMDSCRPFPHSRTAVGLSQNKKNMQSINNKRNWIAHAVAIAVVCCWGCTFVNTKYLLMGGMMPWEIFVCRFLLAYVAIWTISPRRLFADNWKDEGLMGLLGITGGSLYFLAENEAIGMSYVNNVSFIVCTAPLITVILAILFLRSVKASWRLIAGSLLALLGVGFVIFNGHFVLHLNPLGDWLALTAAFSWAVYSLLMKFVADRYSAVFITRKVFFYGLLTMAPMFIVRPWQFPLSGFLRSEIWMNLLFLGFIASFACFALWSWAIGRVGAIKTSNYVYLNPLTTIIASALFLNEPMTSMAWVGSALILTGIYLANKAKGI